MVNKQFCKNPVVSCRPEKPEGGILYNPENDQIELLNITGLTIWELVENNSILDITNRLSKIYTGIPNDSLQKDVSEFITNLLDKGYIIECRETD